MKDKMSNRCVMLFACLLVLSACNREPTLRTICEEHPELCNDIAADGSCRYKRTGVVMARYARMQHPEDDRKLYELLLAFENFRDCIGKASQVEAVKRKERINERVDAFIYAQKKLRRLANLSEETENPYLLYYRWSRLNDRQALQHFVRLDEENKLNEPELQKFLARYYGRNYPIQAEHAFLRSLELHHPGEDVDNEVLQGLSTLYFQGNNYQLAYLWSKITQLNDDGDVSVQLDNIAKKGHLSADQQQTLDSAAKLNLKLIKKGKFVAIGRKQ